MSTLTAPLDGFSMTVTRAWCWGRRLVMAASALVAAVILLEAVRLAELLSRVHASLGWIVPVLGLVLLGWAAWRAVRYLRTPRALVPPDLPPVETGWTAEQSELYRRFAVCYLERMRRNPHLPEEARDRIPAAVRSVETPSDDDPDPGAASCQLYRRVQVAVDEVLAPLDERANALVRRAAVEVSVATAVSPSILLDSLITLARNIDLVTRLADLYYGRPGLGGTLRILRDVIGSAVAAGALEVVTDNVAGVVAEVTGSWSARLLGPVGQGMVNGLVTMRLGAAARQRCRSLSGPGIPWLRWRVADYRRAMGKLYDWVTEEAGPAVARPFAGWLESIGAAARSTVRGGADRARRAKGRWWDRIFSGAIEEPVAEPQPTRGDPLLDSGLLD